LKSSGENRWKLQGLKPEGAVLLNVRAKALTP
jgi:hypothetical protein